MGDKGKLEERIAITLNPTRAFLLDLRDELYLKKMMGNLDGSREEALAIFTLKEAGLIKLEAEKTKAQKKGNKT